MLQVYHVTLRDLIDEKNLNVQVIAENIDVSRSKIYRFLDGSAVPTPEEFTKLNRELYLTEAERERLAAAFRISRIGLNEYEMNMRIEALIADLNSPAKPVDLEEVIGENDPAQTVLNGEQEVTAAIYSMFGHFTGNPKEMIVFMQPDDDRLMELIRRELDDPDSNTSVTHAVRLSSGLKKPANITSYQKLIPMMMSAKRYTVKFHYTNESISNKSMELFPNIIASDDRVLLIASSKTYALSITDPEQVAGIRKEASRLVDKMFNFTRGSFDLQELNRFLAEKETDEFSDYYCIEPMPCLLLLEPSNYEKFESLQPDLFKISKERYANFHDSMVKKKKTMHLLFTLDGLKTMVREGIHTAIPPEVAALSPDKSWTIGLLQSLLDIRAKTENLHLCLLQENPLKLSNHGVTFEVMKNKGVVICPAHGTTANGLAGIVIEEKGVVDAFADYINSLLDYDQYTGGKAFISPEEETIKILKRLISEYSE